MPAEFSGISRKHYYWTLLIVFLLGCGVLAFRRPQEPVVSGKRETAEEGQSEFSYPIMGTMAGMVFRGTPEETERYAKLVRAEFEQVQRLCNIFDEKSEVSALNRRAAKEPFVCSPELWEIIQYSREAFRISDGAFDVTARPLMDLWGFYRRRGDALPGDEEISGALARVGLDKVRFDEKKRSVFFTVPDMAFDFGGIAKGYAVDRARDAVKKAGARQGLINLGGNIFCIGAPPDRDCYRIGIRDPLTLQPSDWTVLLRDQGTATSGGYERFVTIGGRRYAHIMDPATGRPVESLLAVTVVADSAGLADILSTSVFIRGEALAGKLAAERPELSILIFSADGDHYKVRQFGRNVTTEIEQLQ